MKYMMKKYYARTFAVAQFLVLCFLLFGCATKPPDFIHQDFNNIKINQLYVLPVLDHRIDQTKQLELDAWVLPIVEKSLKKKSYTYTIVNDRSVIEPISRESLETSTPEFISDLPPNPARWVLLIVLDDSSSKLTFGSTGNAEMSSYLFDKEKKIILWREKEVSQAGQGGLIGMAMKSYMEQSAIQMATMQMLDTLPTYLNSN